MGYNLAGYPLSGWAYQVSDRLSVELGGVWTKWSTYDSMTIYYDNPLVPINPDSGSSYSPKHWKNVWRHAIGAEYALSDTWDLRMDMFTINLLFPMNMWITSFPRMTGRFTVSVLVGRENVGLWISPTCTSIWMTATLQEILVSEFIPPTLPMEIPSL